MFQDTKNLARNNILVYRPIKAQNFLSLKEVGIFCVKGKILDGHSLSHLPARQAQTSAGAPYLLIITLLPDE